MSKSSITTEERRIVIHPGDVLSDTLAEAGLSAHAAALAMAIPANRLTAIINKRRSVTAETAMRLSRFFGTSAKLWMNLQARYDLQVTEAKLGDRISSEVRPLKKSA
jgi:addiction module HigA family antidote